MAEHVLGRVTGEYSHPSGPDALLDIIVDPGWLRDGRTIEVDLPRNLSCAACNGTGCDACAQSGALTVRERFEPPEVVRVTLPRYELGPDSSADSQRISMQLRVQARGGLPPEGSTATRGCLLLRLRCAGSISECVRDVPDEQVTSSSTLSRAELVNAVVPSSSTTPLAPQQTLISQSATPHPVPAMPASETVAPQTRRSTAPEPGRATPQLEARKAVAKEPEQAIPAVRRVQFRWSDVAIGLFVMLLGAALAWFLL